MDAFVLYISPLQDTTDTLSPDLHQKRKRSITDNPSGSPKRTNEGQDTHNTPSITYNATPFLRGLGGPSPSYPPSPSLEELQQRKATEIETHFPSRPTDAEGRTNYPRDKYLLTEMPDIHDEHPMGPLEGVATEQIYAWLSIETGKILVRPFDSGVLYQPNQAPIARELMAAIREITGSPHISVATPIIGERKTKAPANAGRSAKPKQPIAFLVHDLTADDVTTLLSRPIWASKELTFQTFPFPTGRPRFMFTIENLTTQSEEHVRDLVAEIWGDEATTDFLGEILANFPDGEQPNLRREILSFLDSIQIRRLDIKSGGGLADPHFNVYADSSAVSDVNTWLDIRDFLRNRVYRSMILGTGRAIATKFHCGLCHGKDHPRGLCPFPRIPGWKGPTSSPPKAIRNYTEQSRGENTPRFVKARNRNEGANHGRNASRSLPHRYQK
jgi:hypothetical protein